MPIEFTGSLTHCRGTEERGLWLYRRNPGAFDPAESFWLIGIKHELRGRDPVDAANDAAALARWAEDRL